MNSVQRAPRALALLALVSMPAGAYQATPAPAASSAQEALVTFTDGTVQRVNIDAKGQAHLPVDAVPTKATPVSVRRVAVVPTTPPPAPVVPATSFVVTVQPGVGTPAVTVTPSAVTVPPRPVLAVAAAGPIAAPAIGTAPKPAPAATTTASVVPASMPLVTPAVVSAEAASAVNATCLDDAPRGRVGGKGVPVRLVLGDWIAPMGACWHVDWQARGIHQTKPAQQGTWDGPALHEDVRAEGTMGMAIEQLIKASGPAKGDYPLSITYYRRQHLIVVQDRK